MFYLMTRKLRLLVSVSYYRSGISNSEGQALLQNGSGPRVGVRRPEDEHPGMEPPQRADPTAAAGGGGGAAAGWDSTPLRPPPPTELLQLELKTQQLKDESLWNYSYKKAVGLMVRKNPPPRWTSLCSLTAMTRRPAEQRREAPSGVLQAGGTWPRG